MVENIEQLRAMIKAIPPDEKGDAQIARLVNDPNPMKRMLAAIEANNRARARQAQKAMQGKEQQGRPPVVQEKLAQLAQSGIGGLDVGQDMFAEDAYAGGGIVAFDQGGGVNYEDPLTGLSGMSPEAMTMDKLRVDTMLEQKRLAEEKQRYEYLKRAAPETAMQMLKKNPALEPAAASPTAGAGKPPAPAVNPNAKPPAAKPPVAAVDPNAKPAGTMDPFESIMGYLKGDAAERAEARKDAKNMAMLETGLEMLAGDSPYAFQNIGKAGAKGVRGYQERLGALRKEERDIGKGLAEIGLKKYELGQAKDIAELNRKSAEKVAGIYANAKNTDERFAIDKATQATKERLKAGSPEGLAYLREKDPVKQKMIRDRIFSEELSKYSVSGGAAPTSSGKLIQNKDGTFSYQRP